MTVAAEVHRGSTKLQDIQQFKIAGIQMLPVTNPFESTKVNLNQGWPKKIRPKKPKKACLKNPSKVGFFFGFFGFFKKFVRRTSEMDNFCLIFAKTTSQMTRIDTFKVKVRPS